MVLKKVLHSGQQIQWHRSKTMSVFYRYVFWVCVMWKIKQTIKSKQYKWRDGLLYMKCCTLYKDGWVQFVYYQEFAKQYRSYKTFFYSLGICLHIQYYSYFTWLREWHTRASTPTKVLAHCHPMPKAMAFVLSRGW